MGMIAITGADLGVQAWIPRHMNGPPSATNINPPTVLPDHPRAKPDGGFWTSTYDDRLGSGWVQWCLSEEFDCDPSEPTFTIWTLEPDPEARVYRIASYADLVALVDAYEHRRDLPDRGFGQWHQRRPHWERIAADFDAVHMTEEGQWQTRLTEPLNLYGWDCESTLWLRWAFTSATNLGRVHCESRNLRPEEVSS